MRDNTSLAKWPSPNRFVPFALSGNPALVVCSGFSRADLPLSIQLVGKPFDDANVLAIAHAYEQATPWSQRRAVVALDARPAPITPRALPNVIGAMDPKIIDLCAQAAHNAGLRLADEHLALLCGAAPQLLEMIERVRGSAEPLIEPANVFASPQSVKN